MEQKRERQREIERECKGEMVMKRSEEDEERKRVITKEGKTCRMNLGPCCVFYSEE